MPGLIVFKRRWSVGSDDLVVPGVFLFTLHLVWLIILSVILGIGTFDQQLQCVHLLVQHIIGYIVILAAALVLELCISIIAMRGSILDTKPRAGMRHLLYIRLVIMVAELVWLILGSIWLAHHYELCPGQRLKDALLGMVICNGLILVSVAMTVWCTFDAAGRSWVKMKKFQRSMREGESRFQYRRSTTAHRNWRQRKVLRAYQNSWDHRCRLLFCCMPNSDRNRNSFADIARILSDFFRDLDVVPSDVVAGLVLLRQYQKFERETIVSQPTNDTFQYLSGVPVTSQTRFLALNQPSNLEHFRSVIYYMHYALGAYGWPMYLMTHSSTGICHVCSRLRFGCLPCLCTKNTAVIVEDNCCQCNYAALQKMVQHGDIHIVYATYHVDVGKTPFFVAVDYTKQKIVISIRGTLSMKDVVTDLNAESEVLPLNPSKDDWLGHKGMVHAAEYIRIKLHDEGILSQAFNADLEKGTSNFELVLVGHSLGAGTAAILAILMKHEYPTLECYSYSPPGGLLSMPAVEYTKSFITSVVLGKDVVPRIGLHQMESLRADLINTIKRSTDPKWKTIMCSVVCCGCSRGLQPDQDTALSEYLRDKHEARRGAPVQHPTEHGIALSLHQPLYPPGRIIHIVRHHRINRDKMISKREPVYQAVWANNTDFDEVLISPVMIQDHMPDNVLKALYKVVTSYGPNKPQRASSTFNAQRNCIGVGELTFTELSPGSPKMVTPPHRLCFETSFTSLRSPSDKPNPPSLPSSSGSENISSLNFRASYPALFWECPSILEELDVYELNNRLINNSWLNLAPLASPESFSDLSDSSTKDLMEIPRASVTRFSDASTLSVSYVKSFETLGVEASERVRHVSFEASPLLGNFDRNPNNHLFPIRTISTGESSV